MDDADFRTSARDARRQAIVAVARDIFLNEGFADASMSSVAARVGGSKGTLYNYFPSKQELFAAVIVDECDRKQAALFDTLEAKGEDVAAVLRSIGLEYTRLVLQDDSIQLNRVVIAESGRFPELGRALYEAGPRRGRVRLAAYLRTQMEVGRLRAADPMRMAEQFCDMCVGGRQRQRLMNMAGPPTDAELGPAVEAAVEVVLRAYAPPEAPAPSPP